MIAYSAKRERGGATSGGFGEARDILPQWRHVIAELLAVFLTQQDFFLGGKCWSRIGAIERGKPCWRICHARHVLSISPLKFLLLIVSLMAKQIGPSAIQQVFDATTKRPITSITQLMYVCVHECIVAHHARDGHGYVCAGFERLHDLEYEAIASKKWCARIVMVVSDL